MRQEKLKGAPRSLTMPLTRLISLNSINEGWLPMNSFSSVIMFLSFDGMNPMWIWKSTIKLIRILIQIRSLGSGRLSDPIKFSVGQYRRLKQFHILSMKHAFTEAWECQGCQVIPTSQLPSGALMEGSRQRFSSSNADGTFCDEYYWSWQITALLIQLYYWINRTMCQFAR